MESSPSGVIGDGLRRAELGLRDLRPRPRAGRRRRADRVSTGPNQADQAARRAALHHDRDQDDREGGHQHEIAPRELLPASVSATASVTTPRIPAQLSTPAWRQPSGRPVSCRRRGARSASASAPERPRRTRATITARMIAEHRPRQRRRAPRRTRRSARPRRAGRSPSG